MDSTLPAQAPNNDEIICKICHSPCDIDSPYAHPCKCKGTLKFIHVDCLNEWLKLTKTKKCDICNHPFKFEKIFKIGTPINVPPYYILLFLVKGLASALSSLLFFIYRASKFIVVFAFNSAVSSRFVLSSPSFHISFFTALLFTFLNFLHSLFINKALRHISALRPRIHSSQVLNSLIADISSRDETITSMRSNVSSGQQSSSESNNDQVLESHALESRLDSNIFESLFRNQSTINIMADIRLVLSLCSFSALYPLFYYFSLLYSSTLLMLESKFAVYAVLHKLAPTFFNFIGDISLEWFFIRMSGVSLLFMLMLAVLGRLKAKLTSQVVRNAFYLLKCYFMSVVTSFVLISSIGVVSHFFFAVAFNHSVSVFQFKEATGSIVVHVLLGLSFTYLSRDLKRRLMRRFRDGLIMRVFKDDSFGCVLDYFSGISMGQFMLRTVQSFMLIGAFPFSIFCLSRIKLEFGFGAKEEFWSFLYLKAFLILYRNGTSITKFLAWIFESVVRWTARLFDGENYLYNKKIGEVDRSRLVWRANTRYMDKRMVSQLEHINGIVSANGNNLASESSSEAPSGTVDGLASGQASASFHASPHALTASGSINNSNVSAANTTPIANTSSHPSHSKSLINSINETEKLHILSKYQITETKINKYYGKTHTRKFSIFKLPKLYWAFKPLCFLACLFVSCVFFNLVFRAALLLSRLAHREKIRPVLFVYNACLILALVSRLPDVFSKPLGQLSKAALNSGFLALYTNALFPLVGAVAFVVINASRNVFAEFSNTFLFLNALSSVTSSFFEAFFLFSPIASYSLFYLIRQCLSFLGMKMFIFFSFVAYTRIMAFGSMYIPIVFTCLVLMQVVRFVRVVASGTFMETIKDHFFLDNTTVVNYQDSD